MRVLAGISGGVDSAVAAALLKQQGFDVTGATMSIWKAGKYRGGDRDACFGPGEAEDIEAAREVCRILDIPYHVIDCSAEYERIVLDYFRSEYLAGRTPNPCVRCNSLIKFGTLPHLAAEAGIDFDRFATGHYARVTTGEDGEIQLWAGVDPAKDQSYFLYRLSKIQLGRILLPLGAYRKAEVRKLAEEFGLPVHDKPDSQDFYSGDQQELIGEADRPGHIVDASGKILGHHTGFWKYTVGQRKGLGIAAKHPLYVIEINQCRNEVVVGDAASAVNHTLRATDFNWVSIPAPAAAFEAEVKVRSAGKPVACLVQPLGHGDFAAEFADGITAVTPGQSAVFYRGELLLGGGIITAAT
jgi:tRNA-specific 2-thiouridylase